MFVVYVAHFPSKNKFRFKMFVNCNRNTKYIGGTVNIYRVNKIKNNC